MSKNAKNCRKDKKPLKSRGKKLVQTARLLRPSFSISGEGSKNKKRKSIVFDNGGGGGGSWDRQKPNPNSDIKTGFKF